MLVLPIKFSFSFYSMKESSKQQTTTRTWPPNRTHHPPEPFSKKDPLFFATKCTKCTNVIGEKQHLYRTNWKEISKAEAESQKKNIHMQSSPENETHLKRLTNSPSKTKWLVISKHFDSPFFTQNVFLFHCTYFPQPILLFFYPFVDEAKLIGTQMKQMSGKECDCCPPPVDSYGVK